MRVSDGTQATRVLNPMDKGSRLKTESDLPHPDSTSHSTAVAPLAWPWRLLLILLAAAMLTLAFPPFYLWPLALLALCPLGISALDGRLGWRWLAVYYLAGLLYFLGNSFWLIPVTFGGYFVLSLYMGVYWPIFAWSLRFNSAVLRWPAAVLIPIFFTALEYLRSTLFSGFSWFMLGTALAPSLHLLQAADLFGVSGLTFLCGVSAGWLVDGWMVWRGASRMGRRGWLVETILVAALFAAVWGYGSFRLGQPLQTHGPRVAVISGNVPQALKDSGSIAADQQIFNRFFELSKAAARQHPSLIAWPETMVGGYFNRQWLNLSPADFSAPSARRLLRMDQQFYARLRGFAQKHHLSFLVGSAGIHYDAAGRPVQTRNLAIFITPHGPQAHPYAKHHLVPFGEYVPFAYWPWLHHLLLSLTPFGPNDDYSLTPGKRWRRFMLSASGHKWRFGTPICYEDAMPRPSRMFVRPRNNRKGADFLISISNDGWYYSRVELQQHLQMDSVRAVEERVPIARSVNGGDSGFVGPDGRVIKLVQRRGHTEFISGFTVARLPVDLRISLFSRIGDAGVKLLVVAAALLMVISAGLALVERRRDRHKTGLV